MIIYFFKLYHMNYFFMIILLDLLLIQMKNLQVLVVFVMIGLCSSILMENTQSKAIVVSEGQGLGFNNQAGPNTTKAEIASFINFINSGSIYFPDDNKSRFEYISNKMNSSYGESKYGFSLIQMGNETNYHWSIFSGTYDFASLSPGYDLLFRLNSYLYFKEVNYESSGIDGRSYISTVGQKGEGVDSTLENLIKSTILQLESSQSTCSCDGKASSLILYFYNNYKTEFKGLCSEFDSFKAYVYVKDKNYIYTRPKNCYYLLYEN